MIVDNLCIVFNLMFTFCSSKMVNMVVQACIMANVNEIRSHERVEMTYPNTQKDRDDACKQAFSNIMNIVHSLNITIEQRDILIYEIVSIGHHKETSGWHRGYTAGRPTR